VVQWIVGEFERKSSGATGGLGATDQNGSSCVCLSVCLALHFPPHAGKTALHYAARNEHLDVVKFIVMHSIEGERTLNATDYKGRKPVQVCLELGGECETYRWLKNVMAAKAQAALEADIERVRRKASEGALEDAKEALAELETLEARRAALQPLDITVLFMLLLCPCCE
jgi:hypothetical protein